MELDQIKPTLYYEFLTIKEPSGHQVVVFADGCVV